MKRLSILLIIFLVSFVFVNDVNALTYGQPNAFGIHVGGTWYSSPDLQLSAYSYLTFYGNKDQNSPAMVRFLYNKTLPTDSYVYGYTFLSNANNNPVININTRNANYPCTVVNNGGKLSNFSCYIGENVTDYFYVVIGNLQEQFGVQSEFKISEISVDNSSKFIQNLLLSNNDLLNRLIKSDKDLKDSIDKQTQQQHQDAQDIKDSIEGDNLDTDSIESSKNDTADAYKEAEDALINKDIDLNSTMDLALDGQSATFTWDTLTKFIKSHAKIFNFVISMLSIGLIKLFLNR